MAEYTADFEAGVNGNTITTGAGEASATAWTRIFGTHVYDNTHVHSGTLAAKMDATTAFGLIWDKTYPTDFYGRFYVYATANPAANTGLVRVAGTGVTSLVTVRTDGKIDSAVGGDHVIGTQAIALNQWIRLEYHVIVSATVGLFEIKLYNSPESGTPTETIGSTANRNTGSSAPTELDHANGSGGWGGTIWFDDIITNATSYPGPIASPTQTLLASADSVDGAWTDQAGGTTLAAAIDEATADNADYIHSELSPSTSGCRVKLAAGSDPASSTDHTIKWRIGKNAAGGQTINMTVKLYQGGGNSQGGGTLIASFDRNGVTNTITEYTETLSGAEADAITDYADLYLEFFANAT